MVTGLGNPDFDRELIAHGSSQILSIKYAYSSGGMLVSFRNGSSYFYPSIPSWVFKNLAAAESIGSEFSRIKQHFKGQKIS